MTSQPNPTPRLILHPWNEDSAFQLFPLLSADAIYDFIPAPPPTSLREFDDRHRPHPSEQSYVYVACPITNGAPVGLIQMKQSNNLWELGYLLAPAFWGLGYASEMIAMTLERVRRLAGPLRATATVDCRNIGSIIALERNGFLKTGERETMLKRRASIDVLLSRDIA